jgi:hypothetical protein
MTPEGRVLLVEGRDEIHVCQHLLRAYAIPECCTLEKQEGVNELLVALPIYLENTVYQRVGMIVDADESIARRWQSVRNTLISLGYLQVPAEPDPDGTIVTAPDEGRPVAGVWIMPDNQASGMLEDFIRFLVPGGDPLLQHAVSCVEGIPAVFRRFPEVRRSKAVIHTWLAWQEEPGAPLGLSITKKYLDAGREHGQRFAAWYRRLFIEAVDSAAGYTQGNP